MLGREALEVALRDFGITAKETEVYIFLVKRGAQKTSQISKQLRMNKGLVHRVLKNLQKKGLVEATLEYPTRFTAVAFENVINAFIKAKQEEVARIEEAKETLLSDWKEISKSELESALDKFSVIEGKKKILQKISQMIKEADSKLSAISTVSELLHLDQFSVFDFSHHNEAKPKVQFNLLTELNRGNLKAAKLLKAKLKAGFDFKGRNPDLGFAAFPRLLIKDNEEIMFFITRSEQDVCFCTNCKSLIRAFTSVFNNFWSNSTDIDQKIMELETGKPLRKMILIKDAESARRRYEALLKNAQDEVLIVTSSEGLVELYNRMEQLKRWNERGVAVRILAPVIEKNFQVSQKLLEICEIKHLPISYLGTTLIDGQHLFQFKHSPLKTEDSSALSLFRNTFYTNDLEYIEKTKNMLQDIWEKACVPSAVTIESIIIPTEKGEEQDSSSLIMKNFRKVTSFSIEDDNTPEKLTEKHVLNKILKADKHVATCPSDDASLLFASTGQAIIHPPKFFNLPDMMFHAWHIDDHSTHGGGENLVIHLWTDSPSGSGFVPTAIISNAANKETVLQRIFSGTPAEHNVQFLNKDEFHVRVHGNTLFVGWTVPLILQQPQNILPPCCLLLESVGKVKTGRLSIQYQNGFKNKIEFNAFEALVTFFHPSSQYEGPGTDGIFFREYVGESVIP